MSYKTRNQYLTGMTECFKNCQCFMCKREKEHQKTFKSIKKKFAKKEAEIEKISLFKKYKGKG